MTSSTVNHTTIVLKGEIFLTERVHLFIIDKREIVEMSPDGAVLQRLGAPLIHMLDELECLLVPVDQPKGVVLWGHREELKPTADGKKKHIGTPCSLIIPVPVAGIETIAHLLVLSAGDVRRESSKVRLPICNTPAEVSICRLLHLNLLL